MIIKYSQIFKGASGAPLTNSGGLSGNDSNKDDSGYANYGIRGVLTVAALGSTNPYTVPITTTLPIKTTQLISATQPKKTTLPIKTTQPRKTTLPITTILPITTTH